MRNGGTAACGAHVRAYHVFLHMWRKNDEIENVMQCRPSACQGVGTGNGNKSGAAFSAYFLCYMSFDRVYI